MLRQLSVLLLVAAASYAFSIDSYYNHMSVLPNGDLRIYESINFTLEKQYNEGFRSIRPADAPSPDYVSVDYVKVDGVKADSYVDVYDGETEIVWTTTHEGRNAVELEYVLKNRTEQFDDFDRVCYEHFGANWAVPAARFESVADFPEASRGRTVHFQIYSAKEGNASLEDLSVVTRIEDVPSGNYVGGCYLFPKDAVNATRLENGSAFDILQDERRSYGSQAVLEPDRPTPFAYCCVPVAVLLAIAAAASFARSTGRKKMEENILPPSDEEPAVVAAIARNEFPEKDVLAATILSLINRGYVDILELERKGEDSAEVKRERTILILKKSGDLKTYEQAVLDMIFEGKKEVDLDERAKQFDSIDSQSAAQESVAYRKMSAFRDSAKASVIKKGEWLDNPADNRLGIVAFFAMFAIFIGIFAGVWAATDYDAYAYYGELWMLWALLGSIPVGGVAFAVFAYYYVMPKPIKGHEDEFAKWDGFARAVRSSRLKEYPPASVAIWGDILVYATALGLADKVKRHLSELDSFTAQRIEKLDSVRKASYVFYASSLATSNLGTYGNKAGSVSSGSSGGWSSGGGGGFSGGSSGGGGFR